MKNFKSFNFEMVDKSFSINKEIDSFRKLKQEENVVYDDEFNISQIKFKITKLN